MNWVRLATLLALPLLSNAQQQPPFLTLTTPERLIEQGAKLSSTDAAQELEAKLEADPSDLTSRTKLLGYYYYQWMRPGAGAAKAARRRHILWLIENRPGAPVLALGETEIEQSDSQMADPEAFEQARKLWTAHLESGKATPRSLGNLARFFQMKDKELAESALLKARSIEPANGEWDWRLGYLYAMGILGVDALGLNGQPTSTDPFAPETPFYARATQALAESKSGMMLYAAASHIWRYGMLLAGSEVKKMEYVDQAIKMLEQAKRVEPNNPSWPQFLSQLQAYKRQALAPASRVDR
jgi:tetratricopeptide (TPR) repeat protein